jgi:XTP/dITP diphosphohydrolase
MDFVLATANTHKAQEMRAVLGDLGFGVLPRPSDVPDVDETSETLEGNALLKARALCDATGSASIADDTGLFVDVLEGLPGVRSARYAGDDATDEENVEKLLNALAGIESRAASFRTVICVAYPDGSHLEASGELPGVITHERRGTNGFGYDPVFEPLETVGQTLGELDEAAKNEISHRARALQALAQILAS